MSMVSDHTKYIKDLKTTNIPIYGNKSVHEKFPGVHVLDTRHRTSLDGEWDVIPFEVPHTHSDGTECQNYAYLIDRLGERLLYMTDWMFCRYDLSPFNINHFLIAINYTELDAEEAGKNNHVLHGHSSLETALEFLKTSMTDACRSIIACHLSQRNCDELKVMEGLVNTAPTVRTLAVAKKGIRYTL